jgi:hypothetical protein
MMQDTTIKCMLADHDKGLKKQITEQVSSPASLTLVISHDFDTFNLSFHLIFLTFTLTFFLSFLYQGNIGSKNASLASVITPGCPTKKPYSYLASNMSKAFCLNTNRIPTRREGTLFRQRHYLDLHYELDLRLSTFP